MPVPPETIRIKESVRARFIYVYLYGEEEIGREKGLLAIANLQDNFLMVRKRRVTLQSLAQREKGTIDQAYIQRTYIGGAIFVTPFTP